VVFLKEYKAFQQMLNEAVTQLQLDTEEKNLKAIYHRDTEGTEKSFLLLTAPMALLTK
jgi:hypothetical protein